MPLSLERDLCLDLDDEGSDSFRSLFPDSDSFLGLDSTASSDGLFFIVSWSFSSVEIVGSKVLPFLDLVSSPVIYILISTMYCFKFDNAMYYAFFKKFKDLYFVILLGRFPRVGKIKRFQETFFSWKKWSSK